MSSITREAVDERPSAVADEAGTAPEDRRFRPDVQGLRAVAVALVVLFHAGVRGIEGGYVGVDVFFVISGFVITGVLLRERAASGRTSLVAFYARRCRRIIPAASVVLVVTVVASYIALGELAGARAASDGRWAALFAANVHFAAIGTNYLASQAPPSPLQHFWSLAVEEQFYVVYPTLFLVVAAVGSRASLRTRLAALVVVVIVASYVLSVLQTSADPTGAYFSPWTRAWELALGALVALGAGPLRRLPPALAAAGTWLGLAAVVYGACAFDAQTAYPGSLVAIPVVGAACIIAGGTAAPARGAESVLRLGAFQYVGKLSYSLYLWHWPMLIVVAEAGGKTQLPLPEALGLVALAVAASAATYAVVENPVRHAAFLARVPWRSVVMGVTLVVVTVAVTSVALAGTSGGAPRPAAVTTGSQAEVARLVQAAQHIHSLPGDLTPSLKAVTDDFGGPPRACFPTLQQTTVPTCLFGDPTGTHSMVLSGDSHALMWFDAFNAVAKAAHWRLYILGKGFCMAGNYPTTASKLNDILYACRAWHYFAVKRIKELKPDLVVLTQENQPMNNGKPYPPALWQQRLEAGIRQLRPSHARVVVLGNIPAFPQSPPDCLATHHDDVQACAVSPVSYLTPYNAAEQRAAATEGAQYVSVLPWLCARRCEPVIGRYEVYFDRYHLAAAYTEHLETVVADAIHVKGTS
ncbi:MAG TPA: acyltransferase family protein [Acidimicrobiales bacterium]|nr:acyltransferase family protein [Acidimicrobiales bacterium]